MPTSIENYIFNELPRRLVLDSSIATGSSLTASWVLVATGVGTQAIPVDPATLGFEPVVTPGNASQYYRGDKTWADLNAAAVGAIAASEKGQALGVATLDADGYVQLSQMNPAVIERVVVVADEAARYALTTAQVQNGDVVNQQSPAPSSMWYVVDQTNLDNASGYLPFSAGIAASVAWSGVSGKPAIIGDLENISLASEGDLLQYVGGAWVNVDPATVKSSLSLEISDINLLQDGLDGKQTQSAVLDKLALMNTSGIVVRTSGGDFLGRELVGINGITVAEPKGDADNPTLSLTETGVTAGTYGDEFNYPVVEIDEFGRNISVTTQAITRNPIKIQDVSSTTLQANTEHIFGNGIATYTNSISLELPDNVPGGTWVKIKCGQDFIQATGSVTINAPVGKTVQGDPSFPFSSYFKLYPFSTIDLVYSSPTGNWTILTNATSFLSSLHVARQGATDGVSNSHSIISNATSPRSLSIPDRDVDLSSVGQTDFADNVFTVSDNDDPTKKVAFSVGAISAGETRVVTIPDHNVNLGLVGQTDFLDTAFRVSDNTDATKKIAFQASDIATGQTRTITMPNADVNLGPLLSSPVYTIANNTLSFTKADGTNSSVVIPSNLSEVKNASFNAVVNRKYILRDAGSNITVTLPPSPSNGDIIEIQVWDVPSLRTVAFNGNGKDVAVIGSSTYTVTASFIYYTHKLYFDSTINTWQLNAVPEGGLVDGAYSMIRSRTNPRSYVTFELPTTENSLRKITVPDASVDLGNVAQAATTSTNGYLTSADWNTFNGKAITLLGDGNTITLEAGKNYVILASNAFTLDASQLSIGKYVEVKHITNSGITAITVTLISVAASGKVYKDDTYTTITSVDIEPRKTSLIHKTTDNADILVGKSGAFFEYGFKLKKSLSMAIDLTFNLSNMTSNRSITMANANVDLGNVAQAASTSTNGYLTSTDWNTFNNKKVRIIRVSTQTYTVTTADADGCTSLYIEYTGTGNPTVTIPANLTNPITIFNFSYPKPLNITWPGSYPVGGMGATSPFVISGLDGIRVYPYRNDGTQYYQVEWVNRTRYSANMFLIYDFNDSTKNIGFNASGVGAGQFRIITMPDADVNLGNVAQAASTSTAGYLTSTDWSTFNNKLGLADVRYVFLNDYTTQQTTYTVPASAVTAAGRTIIELSNNSLTSITVDTNTGTNKSIGDSVNISITGLYAAQVLVAGVGVTLQGDLTFSYQHQTKTLVYKGSNVWKIVG